MYASIICTSFENNIYNKHRMCLDKWYFNYIEGITLNFHSALMIVRLFFLNK